MRWRYKTSLLFIFILLMGCIVLRVSYAFYVDVIKDESSVVVDGKITINYLNGQEFKNINDAKLKFSVTNNGNETLYYYIALNDVIGKDVTYSLRSDEIDLEDKLETKTLSNYIEIDSSETQNYELILTNGSGLEYSGFLMVGTEVKDADFFADVLLENNKPKDKPITYFKENAISNEGLIKTSNDDRISYYFRGKVDNNYVSFADLTWRIVKINNDGSVKLVLDSLIESISPYYDEGMEFASSKILQELESWYELNLVDYSDYIASHKYCNDTVYEDETSNYAAYNRISLNFIPNTTCLGEQVPSKIGLLTADEVAMAGATSLDNKDFYLYNENITTDYFTMTSAKLVDLIYHPFIVTQNGALRTDTSGKLLRGIRPVINIIKNSTVSGSGTYKDPYVINIEEE